MSHYTVLVLMDTIPDDVEHALSLMLDPYDENKEVAPYRRYMDDDDITLMRKHYEVEGDDLGLLVPHIHSWTGRSGGREGDRLYSISTYNPDSKWDYWSIGGRWRGALRVKPHIAPRPTDRHLLHPSTDDDGILVCDGGAKCLLDLDGMRVAALTRAHDEYDRFEKIVAEHGPLPASLRDIDHTTPEFAAAKDAYWSHPTIKALEKAGLFNFMQIPTDRYGYTREVYAARAAAGAIPGYALLDSTGWHEPGRMGWFGMSSDTQQTQSAYWEVANQKIDALPDNGFMVMVDCHI